MSIRRSVFVTSVSVVALAGLVAVLGMLLTAEDAARADHETNPASVNLVAIDMDTTNTDLDIDPHASEDGGGPDTCRDGIDNGPDTLTDAADPDCQTTVQANTGSWDGTNAQTNIGPIDACYSIPDVAGAQQILDVVVDQVPDTALGGFGFRMTYDPAVVKVVSPTPSGGAAGGGASSASVSMVRQDPEGVPVAVGTNTVPDTDGSYTVSHGILAPTKFASGEGVLWRITLERVAAGISPLTLSAVGSGTRVQNPTGTNYPISNLLSGAIAVGEACPPPTDVAVTGATLSSPPATSVNTPFSVSLAADVANLGGLDPVSTDVAFTLAMPGDCSTTNPFVLEDQQVPVGPTTTYNHDFTVTCSTPSTHSFNGTISAAIQGAPESHSGNNTAATTPATTDVTASSDFVTDSSSVSAGSVFIGPQCLPESPSAPACTTLPVLSIGKTGDIGVTTIFRNDGPDTGPFSVLDSAEITYHYGAPFGSASTCTTAFISPSGEATLSLGSATASFEFNVRCPNDAGGNSFFNPATPTPIFACVNHSVSYSSYGTHLTDPNPFNNAGQACTAFWSKLPPFDPSFVATFGSADNPGSLPDIPQDDNCPNSGATFPNGIPCEQYFETHLASGDAIGLGQFHIPLGYYTIASGFDVSQGTVVGGFGFSVGVNPGAPSGNCPAGIASFPFPAHNLVSAALPAGLGPAFTAHGSLNGMPPQGPDNSDSGSLASPANWPTRLEYNIAAIELINSGAALWARYTASPVPPTGPVNVLVFKTDDSYVHLTISGDPSQPPPPNWNYTCTPFDTFVDYLGSTTDWATSALVTLRQCDVEGTHAILSDFVRGDTLESVTRVDTVSCTPIDTDSDGVLDIFDDEGPSNNANGLNGSDDCADGIDNEGDGLIDGFEPTCDRDIDGHPDALDNCPDIANDQSNSDEDVYGDACDTEGPYGNANGHASQDDCLDSLDNDGDGGTDGTDNGCDLDGDGVRDSLDQCPDTSSSPVDPNGCAQYQIDEDLDGVCNSGATTTLCTGEDQCGSTSATPVDPNGCGQYQVDEDLDGVCDPGKVSTLCAGTDNCLSTPNTDQTNSDADQYGNACDNCPDNTNPTQIDYDGDGVGNHCDTEGPPGNTDGNLGLDDCIDGIDNDADGPVDNNDPGCDPAAGDTDLDGVPNGLDSCPTVAEDADGFMDGDGCPDSDNDMDGICDPGMTPLPGCSGEDLGRYHWYQPPTPLTAPVDCRNVAEDIDSFHDTDGCPEPDNDEDGFPDATDECPGTDYTAGPDGIADTGDEPLNELLVPIQTREDYDAVIDSDGCHDSPEDDYDGDGLSDEDEVFIYFTTPTNRDTDTDGIDDGVDGAVVRGDQALLASDAFTDDFTGGMVTSRGGANVLVRDAPAPQGVRVIVTGSGGPAVIDACGVTWQFPLLTDANITCGSASAQVRRGPITMFIGPMKTTLPTGTSIHVEEVLPGIFDVRNEGQSAVSINVGGVFIAPGEIVTGIGDMDADGWANQIDGCPTQATPWKAPMGDDDCDGFDTAREEFIGTSPVIACAASTAVDDEAVGAWPVDINDDRLVDLSDVLRYNTGVFGRSNGEPGYSSRFDMNGDGGVDLSDVLAFNAYFGKSCTP